jgi:hypothetical protein
MPETPWGEAEAGEMSGGASELCYWFGDERQWLPTNNNEHMFSAAL